MFDRVTIIGVGLLGASFALALKKSGLAAPLPAAGEAGRTFSGRERGTSLILLNRTPLLLQGSGPDNAQRPSARSPGWQGNRPCPEKGAC